MRRLTTVPALDEALAASAQRPVLFFKHSATCGTSAWAHEQVASWAQAMPPDVDLWLIDVREGRDVSQALATRVGVHHESPQVLLVRDGAVRWHTSHYGVTARAIADAMARERTQ